MAMENKRIIQLNTERTTPAADDYVMVDSATAGTAKYLLPKITDAIDQEISDRTSADTTLQTAITNEATARTNADTTLQGNITAEATARAAADTEINTQVTQLKEDLTYLYDGYEIISFDIIENSYPAADGTFPSYSNWNRSDYIPVTSSDVIHVINTGRSTSDNAWYDSEKSIIGRFSIAIGDDVVLTPPANAAYMVISNQASTFFGAVYKIVTGLATRDEVDTIKEDLDTLSLDLISGLTSVQDDLHYITGKKNLLNDVTWTMGESINASGELVPTANFRYSSLIPVNTDKYFFEYSVLRATNTNVRFHGYDANGNWVKQIAFVASGATLKTDQFMFDVSGVAKMRISTSVESTLLPKCLINGGLPLVDEIKQIDDEINSGNITYKPYLESGGLNRNGKYPDLSTARTGQLLYLPSGRYRIVSDVNVYLVAFSNDNYADGRVLKWRVSGINEFSVSPQRPYVGYMSALDNGSIPTNIRIIGDTYAKRVKKEAIKYNFQVFHNYGTNFPNYRPNSIETIPLAAQNQYDGYRCNVIRTADDEIVCAHDFYINYLARNLDGTAINGVTEGNYYTEGCIAFEDLTLNELKNNYSWSSAWSSSPSTISTLDEFLDVFIQYPLKLRIEFKSISGYSQSFVDKVIGIILNHAINPQDVYVESYSSAMSGYISGACDYMNIMPWYSYSDITTYINDSRGSGNHVVVPIGFNEAFTSEEVKTAKKLGALPYTTFLSDVSTFAARLKIGYTMGEGNILNVKDEILAALKN